jgi:outer membrane receptor for ferrienterochelin and colicins
MILSHTWRSNIGTLESSLANTQTETVGRLIPARAQNMSQAITPRLLESEDTIFDTKFTTNYINGHNITLGGNGGMQAFVMDFVFKKKFLLSN